MALVMYGIVPPKTKCIYPDKPIYTLRARTLEHVCEIYSLIASWWQTSCWMGIQALQPSSSQVVTWFGAIYKLGFVN